MCRWDTRRSVLVWGIYVVVDGKRQKGKLGGASRGQSTTSVWLAIQLNSSFPAVSSQRPTKTNYCLQICSHRPGCARWGSICASTGRKIVTTSPGLPGSSSLNYYARSPPLLFSGDVYVGAFVVVVRGSHDEQSWLWALMLGEEEDEDSKSKSKSESLPSLVLSIVSMSSPINS